MRKYILGMLLMISALTGYGKCDWNTLKLTQSNNRNYYQFKISGGGIGDDTCVGWMYLVYDNQTKKIDTLEDFRGYTDVTFNKKGKYKLYVKVWNKCKKCDTALMREINIQYFDKVAFSKTTKTCNNHIYEMASATSTKGDTCYSYYYYIYSGSFFDNLTKGQWDTLTVNEIYSLYDFPESDLDTFRESRLFNYTYPKNGRYLTIAQCFNWCNYQDTFMLKKVTIDCGGTTGVKDIVKNEDLKIIGYYDMIGRKVEYMELDTPYIIIYNNGKRQKVIRTK